MFKRLLVATDGEDCLERLGSCLRQLHSIGIEQVTFVHAATWSDDGVGIPASTHPQITEMETRLWTAIQDPPTPMTVLVRVLFGKPADVILRVLTETQSDGLILAMSRLGSKTRKGFPDEALIRFGIGTKTDQQGPQQVVPLETGQRLDHRAVAMVGVGGKDGYPWIVLHEHDLVGIEVISQRQLPIQTAKGSTPHDLDVIDHVAGRSSSSPIPISLGIPPLM